MCKSVGRLQGILSDDCVLAAALWRNLFNRQCDDPRQLELLVEYVRKQVGWSAFCPVTVATQRLEPHQRHSDVCRCSSLMLWMETTCCSQERWNGALWWRRMLRASWRWPRPRTTTQGCETKTRLLLTFSVSSYKVLICRCSFCFLLFCFWSTFSFPSPERHQMFVEVQSPWTSGIMTAVQNQENPPPSASCRLWECLVCFSS